MRLSLSFEGVYRLDLSEEGFAIDVVLVARVMLTGDISLISSLWSKDYHFTISQC